MKLEGKTITVTGGAGGIGSKVCELAAQKGATPIIIDRVAMADSPWQYIQGDLSNMDGIEAIIDHLSKIQHDILVNLAGIQHFGML